MQPAPIQTMSTIADITVQTRLRRIVLMVECKFSRDASKAAAARVRDRLLDGYIEVPADSFFMLALGLNFHLWLPGTANDALPTFTADATPVLRPYLGRLADRLPWPGAEAMQISVFSWLAELARGVDEPGPFDAEQMMVSSGLYDVMKHCTVQCEVPP